jgi:YfiH family protein
MTSSQQKQYGNSFVSSLLSEHNGVIYFFGFKHDHEKEMIGHNCQLAVSFRNLVLPQQTHGDTIGLVTCANVDSTFASTDALITNQSKVCIAIKTADCVPVLLYDPVQKAIAAIHSGWRSTVLNIVGKTIGQLEAHYGCKPQNIIAAIGPCIGKNHYEVGPDVAIQFETPDFLGKNILSYIQGSSGKAMLDLRKAILLQLIQKGVDNERIDVSDECTFENSQLFYSARRDGPTTGRMLNGIMIVG